MKTAFIFSFFHFPEENEKWFIYLTAECPVVEQVLICQKYTPGLHDQWAIVHNPFLEGGIFLSMLKVGRVSEANMPPAY
ncbi:MAG: hypothetical protein ABII01_04185 [Candidatus Woesearchaeota archaeon]